MFVKEIHSFAFHPLNLLKHAIIFIIITNFVCFQYFDYPSFMLLFVVREHAMLTFRNKVAINYRKARRLRVRHRMFLQACRKVSGWEYVNSTEHSNSQSESLTHSLRMCLRFLANEASLSIPAIVLWSVAGYEFCELVPSPTFSAVSQYIVRWLILTKAFACFVRFVTPPVFRPSYAWQRELVRKVISASALNTRKGGPEQRLRA